MNLQFDVILFEAGIDHIIWHCLQKLSPQVCLSKSIPFIL